MSRGIPSVDPPAWRSLRVYALDPGLGADLETAVLNEVTLQVPWELPNASAASGIAQTQDAPAPTSRGGARTGFLRPGPVGEYLEVIDVDPASRAFYAPVDLDDPHLLAQNGLPPSEGNPQFHQQMVYAVAMTTVRSFERALGRVALWSPRRWREPSGEYREEYVQRLRIHPHALREANAYYSPDRKALLFGYFPAIDEPARGVLPGGIVFTCLSHDIIAHETTHALLDGMHRRFIEPSNPDVLAFHEAFADICALFQHFSHADMVVHQIARARGDLRGTENMLGQLAQQFGRAVGQHSALRDAIGGFAGTGGPWQPATPDPTALTETFEPHARGAILVGAMFDAFLSIYGSRTRDLLRVATGGTGVLPPGDVHPDLARRLAQEAAKSARHLQGMCIRALDYCPPVDITFGDYLRALITADFDLVRDDDLGYRIAVIEAFRRRGIYPRDVRSLAVDSVRWQAPAEEEQAVFSRMLGPSRRDVLRSLSEAWDLGASRRRVWEQARDAAAQLHGRIGRVLKTGEGEALRRALGIVADQPFEVHAIRPARRIGPDGQFLVECVVEITQRRGEFFAPAGADDFEPETAAAGDVARTGAPATTFARAPDFWFRGGATLLIDGTGRKVRYCIRKDMRAASRLERQRRFMCGDGDPSLHGMYFHRRATQEEPEPFALLHRLSDEVAEAERRRRALRRPR